MATLISSAQTYLLKHSVCPIARLSNGTLYVFSTHESAGVPIFTAWKSTNNGASFSNVASLSSGKAGSGYLSVCAGRLGNSIRGVWVQPTTTLTNGVAKYVSFSNDTFATPGNIDTWIDHPADPSIYFPKASIVVDPLSNVHVIYTRTAKERGGVLPRVYYAHLDGSPGGFGNWETPVQVASANRCAQDICLSKGDVFSFPTKFFPIAVTQEVKTSGTSTSIFAAIGNDTNATSFTEKTFTNDAHRNGTNPQVARCVTSCEGDVYVGYIEQSSFDFIAQAHQLGDSWSTWAKLTVDGANSYSDTALFGRGVNYHLPDVYGVGIHSSGASQSISSNYNDSRVSSSWAQLETRSQNSSYIRSKYSAFSNFAGSVIFEWVYVDGGDLYYDNFKLNY